MHVFSPFLPVPCISLSFDRFTGLPVSFVIGQSGYVGFGFCLYDTHLKTALCIALSLVCAFWLNFFAFLVADAIPKLQLLSTRDVAF